MSKGLDYSSSGEATDALGVVADRIFDRLPFDDIVDGYPLYPARDIDQAADELITSGEHTLVDSRIEEEGRDGS